VKHQDVDELGAGSEAEGVQALASRRSSSSALMARGYAVAASLLPDMHFATNGMPDLGGQRCCAKKPIPPTTISAIPATRKRGRSRLPVLACRSVPGEVGGRSIDHTRSHTIPE
jgi:hypothetical protein